MKDVNYLNFNNAISPLHLYYSSSIQKILNTFYGTHFLYSYISHQVYLKIKNPCFVKSFSFVKLDHSNYNTFLKVLKLEQQIHIFKIIIFEHCYFLSSFNTYSSLITILWNFSLYYFVNNSLKNIPVLERTSFRKPHKTRYECN